MLLGIFTIIGIDLIIFDLIQRRVVQLRFSARSRVGENSILGHAHLLTIWFFGISGVQFDYPKIFLNKIAILQSDIILWIKITQ
jgi:hypothetical protein